MRLAALLLATVIATVTSPAVAQTSEAVIYTGLRPANWDLYLFEGPGDEPRRLTSHPALDYNPVLSPDGRWLVFCSERRGNPDLYALDLEGEGSPQLLIDSPAMEDAPSISPEGQKLAFVSTRDGNAEIFIAPFLPEKTLDESKAENLTNHEGGDFNPAFSPDGQRIVFSSDRHGYKASEIYVMRTDGSQVEKLTESSGWDGSPVWAADGEEIFFYSQRDGDPRIYRMDPDGSDQQPITGEGQAALSPAITPDGRIGYTTRTGGKWRIESIACDGSDVRLESDEQRDYWTPLFGRESSRMVCQGTAPVDEEAVFDSSTPGPFLIDGPRQIQLPDREIDLTAIRGYFPALGGDTAEVASDEGFHRIVISKLDGSGLREVFQPEAGSAWRPTWSKGGAWLACTVGGTFAQPEANVDIWKFRPDGSDAQNLTADSDANDAFPDFSPDGQRIVLRSGRDGNHELYIMRSDGTDVQRLTENDATDTMPAFSPDGNRIAFTSDRDGDYEVYLLDLSENDSAEGPRRITSSPGRDTHPKFSPDAKWLVFASERGGMNDESPLIPVFNPQPYGEIYAVRIEDGRTVRLTHNKWEDGTPTWGTLEQQPDEAGF